MIAEFGNKKFEVIKDGNFVEISIGFHTFKLPFEKVKIIEGFNKTTEVSNIPIGVTKLRTKEKLKKIQVNLMKRYKKRILKAARNGRTYNN